MTSTKNGIYTDLRSAAAIAPAGHWASEKGAILVHVAIALLVLMGISAFVIDYGMVLVSRAEAQRSADAAALAGAVSLAFDSAEDPEEAAQGSAEALVSANNVWGQAPGVVAVTPYTGTPCAAFPSSCVRVDTYRDGSHGSALLPTFFSGLFGAQGGGVRAMAVGWAGAGNASECLKPWGVADKWEEHNPTTTAWTPTSTFDPTGLHPDVYEAPDEGSPGTGFTLAADLGTEMRLKVGAPNDAINPGWFQALDLTGGGGSSYRDNISGCADIVYKIGDEIPKENGNMVGPTGQGSGDLIDLDPDAEWDPIAKKVINSCVGPPYGCSEPGYAQSPRIVAVPVFDLAEYTATGGPGNGTVRLVNILGFFVDRVQNPQNTVVGYLATTPSLKVAGGGTITPESAFAKVIQLVR